MPRPTRTPTPPPIPFPNLTPFPLPTPPLTLIPDPIPTQFLDRVGFGGLRAVSEVSVTGLMLTSMVSRDSYHPRFRPGREIRSCVLRWLVDHDNPNEIRGVVHSTANHVEYAFRSEDEVLAILRRLHRETLYGSHGEGNE